jgi:hypothetical protein
MGHARRVYQVADVALDELEPYRSVKRLMDDHMQVMHGRLAQAFSQFCSVQRLEVMGFQLLNWETPKCWDDMLAYILLVVTRTPKYVQGRGEMLLGWYGFGKECWWLLVQVAQVRATPFLTPIPTTADDTVQSMTN